MPRLKIPRVKRRRTGRYNRPTSHKRRHVSKRKIGYRRRTERVKMRYGRSAKKTSLKKRVARLENVQNKHWDQVSYVDEEIYTFGTRLVGQPPTTFTPGDSYKGILRIQGRGAGGDPLAVPPVADQSGLPALSGVFVADDTNTRESSKIYCTKVRLRGVLRGAFPTPWSSPDVSSGVNVYNAVDASAVAQSKTKIWMIILKDKHPSLQLADGSFTANPLPNSNTTTGVPSLPANIGPLEQMFQVRNSDKINTLTTFGYGGALRKYSPTRFTPVMAKAFELSCAKPEEEFNVTINVNKMLRYKLPRPGAASQLNATEPLNCQYLVMFSCCRDMPTGIDGLPDGGSAAGTPASQYTPKLIRMSSRTYFRDV